MNITTKISKLLLKDKDSNYIWSIISALRAYDCNEDVILKDYTVARLRSFIIHENMAETKYKNKRKDGQCYTPVVNPIPLTEEQIEKRDELLYKSTSHFRTHFTLACDAITIDSGYDLKNESIIDNNKAIAWWDEAREYLPGCPFLLPEGRINV